MEEKEIRRLMLLMEQAGNEERVCGKSVREDVEKPNSEIMSQSVGGVTVSRLGDIDGAILGRVGHSEAVALGIPS